MDFLLISAAAFLVCALGALSLTVWRGRDEVGAQLLVTGTLLLMFYIVGIISGICTVFNFLFRWIF